MNKLAIVYWSGTGNTEQMANLYDEEGLIVNEVPDADAQEVCRELGRKLAAW